MEIRNESAEFIYEDGEMRGFYKQNGTLKLYRAQEADITSLKEIYNVQPVDKQLKAKSTVVINNGDGL